MNDWAKIVDHYFQQLDDPTFEITQVRKDLERNNFDEEEIRIIVVLVDRELQRRLLTSSNNKKAGELIYIGGILTALDDCVTKGQFTVFFHRDLFTVRKI